MLNSALQPLFPPIAHAEGCKFTLADGTVLYDLSCQTLNLALGHRNDQVVDAVQAQLSKVHFASSRFATLPFLKLAERLSALAPGGLSTVILKLTNGSDAIETAVKLGRLQTGRTKIGCVKRAWHGESLFTLAMSDAHAGRLIACPRDVVIARGEDASALAELVTTEGDLAAAIIDPACVSSGLPAVDPREGLQRLRAACDKTNTLLIFDEIQTFGGFLGTRLFASEMFGVLPDAICLGKALGAGFPLAAVICSQALAGLLQYNDAEYTYGGHPVSCAAAIAAIDAYQDLSPQLDDHARKFEILLRNAFPYKKYELRCLGMIATVTLADGKLAETWCSLLAQDAMHKGLLIRSNDLGRRVLIKLPIIMNPDVMAYCIAALAELSHKIVDRLHRQASSIYRDGEHQHVIVKPDYPGKADTHVGNCLKTFGRIDVSYRSADQQQFLTATLRGCGVTAIPVYNNNSVAASTIAYGAHGGRPLSDVLKDPSSKEGLLNAIVLRHYEVVTLAHDYQISLGCRIPENAVVLSDGSLALINFSHALHGAFHEVALLEEVLCVVSTIASLPQNRLQIYLQDRLIQRMHRRHGSDRVSSMIAALAGGEADLNGSDFRQRVKEATMMFIAASANRPV